MKVLVTGGAGYIGSHTARLLALRGYQVVIYDNFSTGHPALTRGFDVIRGDISERSALAEALHGVDAVIHFAAYINVAESVRDPGKYFANNGTASLTLLNAMRDMKVGILVFSSSAAVYGIPKEIPIAEDSPKQPINSYGASKLFVEQVLQSYDIAHNLRSASLRYFNAAGADEKGDIGELHDPETHLIPLALQAASGSRSRLQIYGNDYDTPDGTCIRDYIHVNDLAEAHVLALDYLQNGGKTSAFNVGTGNGHSNLEIVRAVEEVTGRKVPREFSPRRPGDPDRLVADSSKVQRELRWKARRSLHEIVSTAWTWEQHKRPLLKSNHPVA